MEDEIRDELDPHEVELPELEAVDGEEKKKKDLIDEDTVSLEDEIEEELEDEEPFDDVDEMWLINGTRFSGNGVYRCGRRRFRFPQWRQLCLGG